MIHVVMLKCRAKDEAKKSSKPLGKNAIDGGKMSEQLTAGPLGDGDFSQ
jgi:hypothetical protein